MPEKCPTGKLPHSVEVIIMQDLIDQVKPGDRVAITGVFQSLNTNFTKMTGVFKQVLIATNIEHLNNECTVDPSKFKKLKAYNEKRLKETDECIRKKEQSNRSHVVCTTV